MAVRFILGRSGSGKTRYCLESICERLADEADDSQLILLVPEQATYQAERGILNDSRIGGFHQLRILSFNRLQTLLLGKQMAAGEISRLGREMAIQRVLGECRGQLQIFGGSAGNMGMAGRLAATIVELYENDQGAEDLREAAESLMQQPQTRMAGAKLSDLATILDGYERFLADRFIDPDLLLSKVRNQAKAVAFAEGAYIWVDGFSTFSVQQLELLVELAAQSKQTEVAFCVDPQQLVWDEGQVRSREAESLFAPTERTLCELYEVFRRRGIAVESPVVLSDVRRFGRGSDLEHIERNIFCSSVVPVESDGAAQLVKVANPRAELQYVARQISGLVREEGFRYRDIAVVASDLGAYQHYVEAAFGDYKIPFFLDCRRCVHTHPLIELVCAALQCVTEGFHTNDVMAYLKTDLGPLNRDEVDLLENYCLACGISGAEWSQEATWAYAQHSRQDWDEQLIDALRQRAIQPLAELRDTCRSKGEARTSIQKVVAAIGSFLTELKVAEKLCRWQDQQTGTIGDEQAQLYAELFDLLEQAAAIFGNEPLELADAARMLTSVLPQLTLAFIPPTQDQVLIGSIERSRHPDLKAVFLIGATQRQFPVPLRSDSILTDRDRLWAQEQGCRVSHYLEQDLIDRQYLTYIAFTRPSQYLFISYPLTDDEGGLLQPSQMLDHLKHLFVDLDEVYVAAGAESARQVYHRWELQEFLCEEVAAKENKDAPAVLAAMAKDELLADSCNLVLSSVNYTNEAVLEVNTARQFFAKTPAFSSSRLNFFTACPYKHFAGYLLGLQEREVFLFEPVDLGLFYHGVLEKTFRAMKKQGSHWGNVDPGRLNELVLTQIEQLYKEAAFLSSFRERSVHNARILDAAHDVVLEAAMDLAEMARAGQLQQQDAEIEFSSDSPLKVQLETEDGRKFFLRGRIDRVDVVRVNGEQRAVVFDYKRSARGINWGQFYHGLDLQLAMYLLALPQSSMIGAFYIPIEVTPSKENWHETGGQKFSRRATGFFCGDYFEVLDGNVQSGSSRYYQFRVSTKGDPYSDFNRNASLRPKQFNAVMEFAREQICTAVCEMLTGMIDVAPYRMKDRSPCGFCPYRAVCRFDWQVNDYRILLPMDKQTVLDELGAGDVK